MSKADSDLDFRTDEDVKAVSFLNCLYTNPTSLNNKMLELQANLELGDFHHLVFITETWFKPETADKPGSMVKLNGYDLHRWVRSNRVGGGVAIYSRSDLISIEVMFQNLRGGLVEQVWCQVTVGADRILVGCICRPGKNEISDE